MLAPAVALASDKPTSVGGAVKSTVTRPHVDRIPITRDTVRPEQAPAVDVEAKGKAKADDVAEAEVDADANANAGGTKTGASMESAAQTNPGKGNWWADTDGDDDDRISRAEAEANAGLSSRFATIDADGDGFVTREEYAAFYKANASQGAEHAQEHSMVVTTDLWSRFDKDGDGRLTALEIDTDTRLKADFSGLDADGDGFVSQDEYRAFYRPDDATDNGDDD
jgi:Ca2+-binding EF-hand superfamily protein